MWAECVCRRSHLIGFGQFRMANAGPVDFDVKRSRKVEHITLQGDANGPTYIYSPKYVTIAAQYVRISAFEANIHDDEPQQDVDNGKRILQTVQGEDGVSCETTNEQRTNYCIVGDGGSCVADYNDDQTLGIDSDCTVAPPYSVAPAPAPAEGTNEQPVQVTSGCVYDVIEDGKVDIVDLLQVLAAFHMEACGLRADFNNDCIVDVSDLLSLLSAFSGQTGTNCNILVHIDFWIDNGTG